MKQILTALFLLVFGNTCFAWVYVGNVQVEPTNAHYLRYVRYMTVPEAKQTGAAWEAGNDITGKTAAEIQQIVNNIVALETDPRCKEIYNKMNTPNVYFTMRSTAYATAHVRQRLQTIDMMDSFNTDGRYGYYNDPKNLLQIPTTSASYWESSPVDNPIYFRQKEATAYEAISQLCAPPVLSPNGEPLTRTWGECLGAIEACLWWGASQGLGEAAFNDLYPFDQTQSELDALTMGEDCPPGTYNKVYVEATPFSKNVHIPGDWVYFKNYNYDIITKNNSPIARKLYDNKALDPNGIYLFSGENSLYFGKDATGTEIYEGLGIVNMSVDKMKEELADAYNGDLQDAIALADKTEGMYEGIEIKEITAADIDAKITITTVDRPSLG